MTCGRAAQRFGNQVLVQAERVRQRARDSLGAFHGAQNLEPAVREMRGEREVSLLKEGLEIGAEGELHADRSGPSSHTSAPANRGACLALLASYAVRKSGCAMQMA